MIHLGLNNKRNSIFKITNYMDFFYFSLYKRMQRSFYKNKISLTKLTLSKFNVLETRLFLMNIKRLCLKEIAT